jgi:ribosomal-protein-alanine N-acetyltransferase
MTIESLKKEHIDEVYNIEKICFVHPWSYDALENQVDISTSHFLVAIVDDKVVGYMGLQIFDTEGYVTNIAVLPEYRGQGIAKALITKQMENQLSFMSLEVRESNIPAINLYTKMGFENVGIRPNFYTDPDENAIIMTKHME